MKIICTCVSVYVDVIYLCDENEQISVLKIEGDATSTAKLKVRAVLTYRNKKRHTKIIL